MARSTAPRWRRLPIGVELNSDGRAHARVWAPNRTQVELVIYDERGSIAGATPLERDESGYFAGEVAGAGPGTRYKFRLDGGEAFADPASRWQPEGPHGPSAIVDPSRFAWTDGAWKGIAIEGQVISEIHIGTFTPEGTFRAAMEKLDHFADVGITAIEVMPLNEFGGRFGWGYDGVNWFAPSHHYGTPDDVRAFVDAAHARGIGVILDVVYNHLGPDGNYLPQFSDTYLTKQATEWGDAINYDGEGSAGVRELAIENAGYWISEFHFDGLRLDATQNIFDRSPRHLIAEIVERARAAAGDRSIIVVGESEPQDARLITEMGVDALWNDDFHHAAYVAMAGNNDAYLSGYRGRPQEFVSAAKRGFLYQGQYYPWQDHRRGSATLRLSPKHFVAFLESHDQVANLARGVRRHQVTSPATYRAFTALLLLSPQTPMLFQGGEWGSTQPFAFFAGHGGDLATAVWKGRTAFMSQFPSVMQSARETVPDPADPATMTQCRLDWAERERNAGVLALHRDLIALRRTDAVIAAQQGAGDGALDGAVLDDHVFALRWLSAEQGDRLLVVNLGITLLLHPAPEPLLAPPWGMRWSLRWSSEHVDYGGTGALPLDEEGQGWRIPGHSAVFLAAKGF